MAIRIAELGDGKTILRLARAYKLSVYDAAYLELATRQDLPLGTLDGKLALAAAPEHVRLLKI
jgi:predicted nucleic acid-binding protein